MSSTPNSAERYTIRRKILKIFGAAFHIYDETGQVVGYCKQRAFKLKEDIRIYTSEDQTAELVVLKARSIIDFGATYDVAMPTGEIIGSFRRKGIKSSFIRDEWLVFDAQGQEIAMLQERGGLASLARKYIEIFAAFCPQKFDIFAPSTNASPVASIRQHFNWFVYKLGVSIHSEHEEIDELMILSGACLIAAIEGRQK